MQTESAQLKGIDLANNIVVPTKNFSLARVEMSLTIKDNIEKPIMKTVFKGNTELAFSMIKTLVKRFVESFGFSTKMPPAQIEMLTVDTLERFQYESIEDVILFFKMARSGKLGTTNRGVDSNLIFGEWFPKYMEMKAEERERQHQLQKSNLSTEQRGANYEDVMKTYQKNADKLFEKKVAAYVDRIVKNMDRQILEDTIVDWEKDPVRKPYVNLLKAKRRTIK